jgi:hypothetical protein
VVLQALLKAFERLLVLLRRLSALAGQGRGAVVLPTRAAARQEQGQACACPPKVVPAVKSALSRT